METEIWKEIKWFEKYYRVSNTGQIEFLWRYRKNGSKQNWIPWKILNPLCNWKYWHLFVKLNQRKFYIHRLVAQAFLWLDIDDWKMYVCHKDDNPLNNRVDNLFLWTCKDNHNDMVQKWRMAVNWMLPQTKLSKEIIEFIRDSKWKINQSTLAKMFDISQPHISNIHNNKSRKYA
jgi:predicted XRE-type DNA-binding protein